MDDAILSFYFLIYIQTHSTIFDSIELDDDVFVSFILAPGGGGGHQVKPEKF
jgi:hypothetical protein